MTEFDNTREYFPEARPPATPPPDDAPTMAGHDQERIDAAVAKRLRRAARRLRP